MAIEPAQPKQGLETGGLEGASGGLSAMPDFIARGYGEDIVGKRGPEAAAKAVQELIQNSLSMFAQEMSFSCGNGIQAIGNGAGQFAIKVSVEAVDAAVRTPYRSPTLKPWDLIISNSATGVVQVNCGTIIEDAADLTGGMAITSGSSTFSPSGTSHWLYLKFESLSTPTVELKVGGDWTDYPSAYEVTSSGGSTSYTAFYFPLHHFRTTAADGYTAINENLFYRKLAPDCNFKLIHGYYQTGSDQPLVVHDIIMGHEVLP